MRMLFCILFFLQSTFSFGQTEIKSTEGRNIQIIDKHQATVFVFLSPECPLCQNYSLTLNRLFSTYNKKGIRVIGVFPGLEFSNHDFQEFNKHYKIKFPLCQDPTKQLVSKFKASVTPEVIFADPNGSMLYRGRIDNWAYEVSRKRSVITEHDLENAIISYLQHQVIKIKQTKPIGCFIE